MISLATLLLVNVAHADPCPNPAGILISAENDALNYFLADAKAGMVRTTDAWACGPRATAVDLGQYFKVRGLIAYLDNDGPLAQRAFATAKAHGATFSQDYGSDAEALWEGATLPDPTPTTLEIKGRLGDEWLAIDGVDGEPSVASGYHLLQLGVEQAAGAAKVIDATGGELTVVFPPQRTAPDAAPAVEEPPEEEPIVVAEDPPPQVEPAEPVADDKPPAEGVLQAPFVRQTGPLYVDGAGHSVHWRDDLMPMADRDIDGARARRRFRSNPLAQGVALTLIPTSAYSAYLFGWDATVGNNLDQGVSWGATAGFATLGVTAVLWEAMLLTKRPKRRVQIEDAAGRVTQGTATQ